MIEIAGNIFNLYFLRRLQKGFGFHLILCTSCFCKSLKILLLLPFYVIKLLFRHFLLLYRGLAHGLVCSDWVNTVSFDVFLALIRKLIKVIFILWFSHFLTLVWWRVVTAYHLSMSSFFARKIISIYWWLRRLAPTRRLSFNNLRENFAILSYAQESLWKVFFRIQALIAAMVLDWVFGGAILVVIGLGTIINFFLALKVLSP